MSEPPSDQPPPSATTGTTAAGAASSPAGPTGAITSVTPSASATAAAAPAPLSALSAEVLEQRLLSYLGPDERLADWSSSKTLTMSHFRLIIRPNPLPVGHDGATHLCVLCTSKSTARVNLKHTRNATHHLNGKSTKLSPPPSSRQRPLRQQKAALWTCSTNNYRCSGVRLKVPAVLRSGKRQKPVRNNNLCCVSTWPKCASATSCHTPSLSGRSWALAFKTAVFCRRSR